MKRIDQCHVSKSVHDFPFCRLYDLKPYYDSVKPLIVFGCYDEEDFQIVRNHNGLVVIWWCGQDALDFTKWGAINKINVFHVTERVKVYEHVKQRGTNITLNKCSNLAEPARITPLGNKVFAYAPASYPEYHGIEIIRELQKQIPFEFVIGDGSINQNDWRAGACEPIYKSCFIGLVLSHFAGGGASVIELGLRGRKCVTNVVELGNVINWKTTEDVRVAIMTEAKNIGRHKLGVVVDTLKSLDFTNEFLNIDRYER